MFQSRSKIIALTLVNILTSNTSDCQYTGSIKNSFIILLLS